MSSNVWPASFGQQPLIEAARRKRAGAGPRQRGAPVYRNTTAGSKTTVTVIVRPVPQKILTPKD